MITPRANAKRIAVMIWAFALVVAGLYIVAVLCGCAAGRTDSGQIIWGYDIGRISATTNAAAGSALEWLIPAGGAVTAAAAYAAKKHGEEKGWNDAEARLAPPPPSKGTT